jgi:hypothetical protein
MSAARVKVLVTLTLLMACLASCVSAPDEKPSEGPSYIESSDGVGAGLGAVGSLRRFVWLVVPEGDGRTLWASTAISSPSNIVWVGKSLWIQDKDIGGGVVSFVTGTPVVHEPCLIRNPPKEAMLPRSNRACLIGEPIFDEPNLETVAKAPRFVFRRVGRV